VTARAEGNTTVRLAGAVLPGAPIDTSVTGAFVVVPGEKLNADDLVFRVGNASLRALGIEHGDLLIVEPRPDGNAATAELVLVTLRERAYVGRWWTKRGRRALLDHALVPIAEDHDLRVIGAVTVVVREGRKD
jgi:SOS-response transcriptional repressor LexA